MQIPTRPWRYFIFIIDRRWRHSDHAKSACDSNARFIGTSAITGAIAGHYIYLFILLLLHTASFGLSRKWHFWPVSRSRANTPLYYRRVARCFGGSETELVNEGHVTPPYAARKHHGVRSENLRATIRCIRSIDFKFRPSFPSEHRTTVIISCRNYTMIIIYLGGLINLTIKNWSVN